MEHAIRMHYMVSEVDDPILYQRFSEKLEAIIKKYNDNWEQLLLYLEQLRDEIDQGRGAETVRSDPFRDLIEAIAFAGHCPAKYKTALEIVVEQVIDTLGETIDTLNFWDRPAQVSTLEGLLKRIFILSKVKAFIEHKEQLSTEIIYLAKRREADILKRPKEDIVSD